MSSFSSVVFKTNRLESCTCEQWTFYLIQLQVVRNIFTKRTYRTPRSCTYTHIARKRQSVSQIWCDFGWFSVTLYAVQHKFTHVACNQRFINWRFVSFQRASFTQCLAFRFCCMQPKHTQIGNNAIGFSCTWMQISTFMFVVFTYVPSHCMRRLQCGRSTAIGNKNRRNKQANNRKETNYVHTKRNYRSNLNIFHSIFPFGHSFRSSSFCTFPYRKNTDFPISITNNKEKRLFPIFFALMLQNGIAQSLQNS